jgi:hypothetical protein
MDMNRDFNQHKYAHALRLNVAFNRRGLQSTMHPSNTRRQVT